MRGFGGSSGDDAPLEAWLGFLDEIELMQVLEVGLMGGEALLYNDFWSIIDRFANGLMRFALFSNGVLLDDDAVSRLAASRRCSYVQISIDGTERRHDGVRGEGVYRHAIAAIRRLQAAAIPVRVNMVLTHGSAADIAEEARRQIEEIGVKRLRINPVSGDAADRLDESELAEAIQILLPLRKKHPDALRGSGIFKYIQTLKNPFTATDAKPCPNCERLLGLRCSVMADGSVIPCMDAENAVIGNVFQSRLSDLWHGEKWSELRRAVHQPRELPRPECEGCRFAGNCRQNCLSSSALCSERICYRRLQEQLEKRGIAFV
ncbi:MAG: radical SAM protein, partial [Victivallales bacterium]|nr:radical SAM protein [Victivallales bacterium]